MAMIKSVQISCTKSTLLNTILTEIGKVFPNVSSNPTQDNTYAGADGFIFKMTSKSGLQSGYVRLKQVTSLGTGSLGITIDLMENYTPGASGVNGTMTNLFRLTGNNSYYVDIAEGALSQIYNLDIVFYEDSLVVAIMSDGLTIAYDFFFEVGYPNPEATMTANSSCNHLYRAFMMYNNTPASYVHALKAYDGTYNVSYNATSNIPGTNPQMDSTYMIAPLIFRTVSTGNYHIGESQGAFGIPSVNISRGDIINIGSESYRIYYPYYSSSSYSFSYPTKWVAVRIK